MAGVQPRVWAREDRASKALSGGAQRGAKRGLKRGVQRSAKRGSPAGSRPRAPGPQAGRTPWGRRPRRSAEPRRQLFSAKLFSTNLVAAKRLEAKLVPMRPRAGRQLLPRFRSGQVWARRRSRKALSPPAAPWPRVCVGHPRPSPGQLYQQLRAAVRSCPTGLSSRGMPPPQRFRLRPHPRPCADGPSLSGPWRDAARPQANRRPARRDR
jgi:hypothetical protein